MEKLIKVIDNYDFIIVNYATKIELLKLRNKYPWLKTKITTIDDVISDFLGTSSERSLRHIIEKYEVSYEHALILNTNVIFKNVTQTSAKTKLLSSIRTSLISEGILPSTQLAAMTYGHKKVLLLSAYKDHTLLLSLLRDVEANITFLDDFYTNRHSVTKYTTGIDEVYGLLNDIATLLAQGKSANNIKVVRPSKEYIKLIKDLAPQFDIIFNDIDTSLYDFPEVQKFLEDHNNNEVLLHETLKAHEANDTLALRSLKNVYAIIDQKHVLPSYFLNYFIDQVKNTKFVIEENNGIEFVNELPLFSANNDYYFYINFAEGAAPKNIANSPFLTNVEKDALGLLSDETSAKCRQNALISALKHHKNLKLSVASLFMDNEYRVSTLTSSLAYEIVDATIPSTIYSTDYLQYLTNVRRDDLKYFNVLDPLLSKLYESNELRDNYEMFNYQFTGIQYTPKHIYLSATAIELYNNLPFDYFAQNILGLKDDSPSEALEYGIFVHNVFEHSKDDESFKFVFAQFLDTGNFSAKEKFFIENTKEIIYRGFKNFNDYQFATQPASVHKEETFRVPFGKHYTLTGQVDRLLTFKKDGKTYGLIIDFKTGGIVFEPRRYRSGLNLQLPIYGLLVTLDERLGDITPIALVINSVKPQKHTLSDDAILDESSAKSLRFKGLIVNDLELLPLLDPNFTESEFFSGLRVTKAGRVLGAVDQEVFDEYLAITKEKVLETFHKIAANEFPVRTITVNNKRSGEYSAFREISYIPVHEADEENIESYEDEED